MVANRARRLAWAVVLAGTLAGCGSVAAQQLPSADAGPGADGSPGTGATGGEGGRGGSAGSKAIAPPAGMRWVGHGRAAIAVPEEWATNDNRCGTPTKDTVLIDLGATFDCGSPRPAGVESVGIGQLHQDPPLQPGDALEIDGVAAWRTPATCAKDPFGGARTCSATLAVPSLDALFHVASSTDSAEVERILARVRVLDDLVAVPGFRGYPEPDRDAYVQSLEDVGLDSAVRTEFVRMRKAGTVLEVSPAPGTMLRPGDVVTVTVAEGPRSAADLVVAEVQYTGGYLTDAQIRSNPTVELSAGDEIRAYAKGQQVAGAIEGNSLAVDRNAVHPPAWKAISRGTSRLTLSVANSDGTPAVLGVVTVVVS